MIANFYTIVFSVVLLAVDSLSDSSTWQLRKEFERKNSLCWRCANRSSDFLEEHCSASVGYRSIGRCCVDRNNVTVGLDLGNCSLSFTPELDSVTDIRWLNLDNNTNLNCSYSEFDKVFKGLRHLTALYVPVNCPCPGGGLLWNLTETRSCQGQLDTCDKLNITCPNSNSKCISNGPGYYECLCKPSWGGYRCLVQEGIPLLIILCSIGGATILVVVVLTLLTCKRKKLHASGYTWISS